MLLPSAVDLIDHFNQRLVHEYQFLLFDSEVFDLVLFAIIACGVLRLLRVLTAVIHKLDAGVLSAFDWAIFICDFTRLYRSDVGR